MTSVDSKAMCALQNNSCFENITATVSILKHYVSTCLLTLISLKAKNSSEEGEEKKTLNMPLQNQTKDTTETTKLKTPTTAVHFKAQPQFVYLQYFCGYEL